MEKRVRSNSAERADRDVIADRLLGITAGLAIGGASVVIVGSIANYFLFDEQFLDLNAKLEGNLFTWASTVASFGGALSAALHAVILPARRLRFAILAAILAFLSLDDLIEIHERVASNISQIEHIEIVIFAPAFATAFLIVWALAREVSKRAGRFLRLGMVLLGVAILIDFGATATTELEEEGTAWPHAVRIAIEEGLELSGWILVSATLTTLLCLALLDFGRHAREG